MSENLSRTKNLLFFYSRKSFNNDSFDAQFLPSVMLFEGRVISYANHSLP